MKYRNHKTAEAVARVWGKPLDRKEWYNIEGDGDEMEIFLYDVIGWPWADVEPLIREIRASKVSHIKTRINSPGGDVMDGFALFNTLRDHPAEVETRVEGMAASIASVIALAGDTVAAHQNAMLMIHEPWTIAIGDQHTMRDAAELLGKLSGNILNIYYQKTGADKKKLRQEMEDETWFTAAEAKSRKLIDSIIEEEAAQAAFDLSLFDNPPEGFEPEGRELNARDLERALRDAGFSRSVAKHVVKAASPLLRDAEGEAGDSLREAEDLRGMADSIQTLISSLRG